MVYFHQLSVRQFALPKGQSHDDLFCMFPGVMCMVSHGNFGDDLCVKKKLMQFD